MTRKGWRIPYKTFADGGVRNPESSGRHFAWLAAISHNAANEDEAKKFADLNALRDSIPERFRG